MERDYYRVCMCITREFRVAEVEAPADVKDAFNKYADGGTVMTEEQLRRFLVEVQGEAEEAAEIILPQIVQKRHHIAELTPHGLTLEDFHYYLFSPHLNPPINTKVHQDMSAPLSHFFIFTGHNSYLTGNQLTSDCSDVAIVNALKKGVRVIELDLWPNSSKDDVRVLHGRTLTPAVSLERCLQSIKEYAFSASPYPLIITLEDHLTPDLQAKLAETLSRVLGKMLFYPKSDCLEEFPSPEELKYRILISTKLPKEHHIKGSKCFVPQREEDCNEDKIDNETTRLFLDDEEAPAYSRLIAILAEKPKARGMKESLKAEADRVRRLSCGEEALQEAAQSYGTDVIRFTQKDFLRVYPKGTRIDSSNYNPQLGWLHGAQMIAFNMQGYGKPLWLMQGMFRANGGCGFVKKPDILMNSDVLFDPKAESFVKKILTVKVYMGDGWRMDFKKTHFDYYSPPDFYVRVGIAGAPADETMKKTKTISDNWGPVWEEEFAFTLTVPEIALLRIEVHDKDDCKKDDFAGQTCLPVSELKPGIRAVALFNRRGEKLETARLLMRFHISSV